MANTDNSTIIDVRDPRTGPIDEEVCYCYQVTYSEPLTEFSSVSALDHVGFDVVTRMEVLENVHISREKLAQLFELPTATRGAHSTAGASDARTVGLAARFTVDGFTVDLIAQPGETLELALPRRDLGRRVTRALAGLEAPDEGEVSIDGVDVLAMDERARAGAIGVASSELPLVVGSVSGAQAVRASAGRWLIAT